MANNELILAPEIDRTALRVAEKNMDEAFERSAKYAGVEARKQLAKGVERGIGDGAKKGVNHLRLAAFSIATAAAAVAIDSIEKTLGGADDVMARMQEKLNQVSETMLTGEAFGIESGAMAALSASFMTKNMDVSDLRGMLSGFTAAIEEEGGEEYKAIRDEKGLEASFLTYLKSISQLDKSQQVGAMIPVLGEEDAALAGRIVSVMQEMTKGGKEITTTSLSETILGRDVDIAGLTDKAEQAQVQSEKLAQTNARAFLDSFKPVSDENINAMQDLIASNRQLEKAHENAFDLKVKTKIIANELEVNQLRAVTALVEAPSNIADKYTSSTSRLIEAGRGSITDKKSWYEFGAALNDFMFGTEGQFKELKEGKGLMDYINRRGAEQAGIIEKWSEQSANSGIQNSQALSGEKK